MALSAIGASTAGRRRRRSASTPRLLAAALVLLPAALAAQQPTTITGQVTGEDGLAIGFVTVTIQTMNIGTLTDGEGQYELIIPASRATGQEVEVVARLVGRTSESQTTTLSPGAQVIDFVLAADPLQLEEIVVTGVGIEVERAKLGVTINEVEATEILQSNESNVVAALAGKVPNVEVTSSSGDPGGGAYIRIRGANSLLGSNQPLFVIDGVPIDNSSRRIENSTTGTAVANRATDLNPADIEDIQVLKGPAAAAVYGSRAANGVILITTKTGQPGTSNVSYSVNYSNDRVSHLQPLNTAYGQGSGGQASTASPFSWGPQLGSGATVYDHAGELYQTANTYDQHLTMSGGSDRTTYYLSLGRLDQGGVIRGNSQYDRTTVRLRASHAFRDDLRLDGNFAYTDSFSELVQTGSNISGIQLGALRTPPDFDNLPYLDPDNGLHRSYRNQSPQTVTQRRGYDNPFWIANEMPNTASVGRTFGNIGVDYTPTPDIRVRYTLGADYSADERTALFPKSSSDFPNGRMIRADLVGLEVDHNLTATLDRNFTPDVVGSLTVGQNLNHREFRRYQVNGQTLFLGTSQLDFTVDQSPNEFTSTIRTSGYFAQGQLDLWDELFFTGGVRYDGSNTFGTGDSHFAYPKVSTAWDFTDYVGDVADGIVSFGKVRDAYGVAGKQPPVFSNVNAFEKGLITDGWLSPNGLETIYGGAEGVIAEGTLGNQDIEPERTTEYEVGADLAFLDDRLSLGVTYYQQKTTDAILDVDVPPSTGFFSKYANAAEFENE
ncbi:MAG: SusC/RagA family TonB-linked outer membrane protein, partial [Gemmatimonadota bacterium]|nr:SusC/RagA family TonB-linked outer membrane protein [Gemmatimonadota bacterium]